MTLRSEEGSGGCNRPLTHGVLVVQPDGPAAPSEKEPAMSPRLPTPRLARVLAGAVALGALSPVALTLAPAHACACPDEGIAVLAPSRTVSSGEEFRVQGVWIQSGKPAAGRTVKVQARRDGRWHTLKGAVVTARANGEFGARLVLQQKGVRVLRVLGVVPDGPDVKDRFRVTVG